MLRFGTSKNKRVIVALLSVSLVSSMALAADLPTNITGVTGNDGIYNIKPEDILGNTGFRHYENFHLSEGDIANLIFKYGEENVSKFVNFVDNTININGILNTMRDGNFYNGHAIFVSPNGMVVGASGVLNVGSLSVLTPTMQDYNKNKSDMFSKTVSDATVIENLKNSKGSGDIKVDGRVIARDIVNLSGANIATSANSHIVSGINDNPVLLNSEARANELFNQLVKTSTVNADSINAENGSITISSHGSEGVSIAGILDGKGGVTINNTNGGILIDSTADVKSPEGKIAINNENGKDLLVKGHISGKGIDIIQKNSGDVIIGDETENDNYIKSNGDINIKIENGSLLNSGVAKTHLSTTNGGNLNIDVKNGSIGKKTYDGVGPDARDLRKSINANIDGTYTASAKSETSGQESVINLAAVDSDMKLNSIKSDGKVYLYADSKNKGEKSYSIVNAAKDPSTVNVEAKGFSLVASGNVGDKDNSVTFNQTAGAFNHDGFNKDDLTYKPSSNYQIDIISKNGDINIKATDDKYDNNVGALIARNGSINANFSGNTFINELTAKENIEIVTRGKNLFIENLGKVPTYDLKHDY